MPCYELTSRGQRLATVWITAEQPPRWTYTPGWWTGGLDAGEQQDVATALAQQPLAIAFHYAHVTLRPCADPEEGV